MDDVPPVGSAASSRRIWLLVTALPVVVACALVPFISVRQLGAPVWLAAVAALLVFPFVPVAWHLAAERRRGTPPGGYVDRLALRSVALAATVLLISLANLGARRVGQGLYGVLKPEPAAAPAPVVPQKPAVPRPPARHELEPYIPADARTVVALSEASVMRQFLAASADAQKKLAALDRCQIPIERARVLFAARDASTRLLVIRAPGITDPRSLYCLVGFLGNELGLRFSSDKAPIAFEVTGLGPRPFAFKAVDAETLVLAEGAWSGAAVPVPAPSATGGSLYAVMARVDRGASLWSASVADEAPGKDAGWDVALDARFEPTGVKLHGSSTPPTGAGDRAELDVRVPLAFAAALPEGSLRQGLRGLFVALTTALVRP